MEESNDDDEESIGCEEDSGLLDGSAVAQEGDDEDERPGRDQDVGALFNYRGLG